MAILQEVTRSQLLSKSKSSVKGKQRFDRRKKSRVANSVKEFNQIDMNNLFQKNIIDVKINVQGETDKYQVRVSFGGFLDEIKNALRFQPKDKLVDIRLITVAIKQCLNREDVYIHCSCPDFKYRFAYWSTVNNYNSGEPQPSNGKRIRNPNDSLGSGCKHCLLVLNDAGWVIKLASTINNYIKYVEKYYEKQYADIIYPALYGKDYEDAVQLTMFDDEIEDGDNLVTDTDILDKSNDYGRTRTQFKTDAEYGINKPNKVSQGTDVSPNQLSLLDNET